MVILYSNSLSERILKQLSKIQRTKVLFYNMILYPRMHCMLQQKFPRVKFPRVKFPRVIYSKGVENVFPL